MYSKAEFGWSREGYQAIEKIGYTIFFVFFGLLFFWTVIGPYFCLYGLLDLWTTKEKVRPRRGMGGNVEPSTEEAKDEKKDEAKDEKKDAKKEEAKDEKKDEKKN